MCVLVLLKLIQVKPRSSALVLGCLHDVRLVQSIRETRSWNAGKLSVLAVFTRFSNRKSAKEG